MHLQPSLWRSWAFLLILSMLLLAVYSQVRLPESVAGEASAASFAGKFSDDRMTLELSESPDGYVGSVTKGDNRFPAKAVAAGRNLTGTFVASSHEFTFTASFADGRLVLVSGGTTYSLARAGAIPLVQGGPAAAGKDSPTAAAASSGAGIFGDAATFGAFTVLGSTPAGKALFLKLPNVTTLESAMSQTADELGKVFDAKPQLSGAFADAKAKKKGGVNLTGKFKGHNIQGLIFCGVAPEGASATVIIATTDATPTDLAALSGSMPAPPVKVQTYKFPDGSGSIDLPEGWTTRNESAAHGIGVQGPDHQAVVICICSLMREPNSTFAKTSDKIYQSKLATYRMQMQAYQQNVEARKRFPNILALQEPRPPAVPDPDPNVRMPTVDFCQYCDGAEEVLKTWYPIREAKQRRAGPIYTSLDKIISVVPLSTDKQAAGGNAAVAYIAMTNHDGDKVSHVRALQRLQTTHLIDGESWLLFTYSMRGPDVTFDRDLPIMSAIMNSVKLDMNVVNGETDAETKATLAAGNAWFGQFLKRGQEFQDRQAAHFNNFERQMAAQQQARHDSASDFIEYIGGVRRVYDTRTGKTFDVNLFRSEAIVNALNESENDPHAYVGIPLRYLR